MCIVVRWCLGLAGLVQGILVGPEGSRSWGGEVVFAETQGELFDQVVVRCLGFH